MQERLIGLGLYVVNIKPPNKQDLHLSKFFACSNRGFTVLIKIFLLSNITQEELKNIDLAFGENKFH